MPHPLVIQLRFARSEWRRALHDVTPEEAVRRFEPMNCISWMIGHLASQENAYWVRFAQDKSIYPDLRNLVGTGSPASTPPLDEMWQVWNDITAAADEYLDTVTNEILLTHIEFRGKPLPESVGTLLQRNIYHYWYHLGESQAVRQLLGHTELPQFVGDMTEAVFRVE